MNNILAPVKKRLTFRKEAKLNCIKNGPMKNN